MKQQQKENINLNPLQLTTMGLYTLPESFIYKPNYGSH
jgi:hypothetical protein